MRTKCAYPISAWPASIQQLLFAIVRVALAAELGRAADGGGAVDEDRGELLQRRARVVARDDLDAFLDGQTSITRSIDTSYGELAAAIRASQRTSRPLLIDGRIPSRHVSTISRRSR